MTQLPLELKLRPHASLDSYIPGPNSAVVEHVRAVAAGDRRDSLWLCGPPNTGKSHLLNAACRVADEAASRAIYLSLDSVTDPEMLRQLDDVDLIALDEAHLAGGDPDREQGLFSLFDARLQRGGLIVAADVSPRECGFALPDLLSRANAAAIHRLTYLGDEDLRAAVITHAAMRGLSLEPAALGYLLQRVSRDLGDLTLCLDRVDRYALATQRKVTIPLLREVIAA